MPSVKARAQQDTTGWNAPRALDLMQRARVRRILPSQDTMLRNYTAKAEGFVYFYLDRRDGAEPTLINTNQVALELFWAAVKPAPGSSITPPPLTKQRIVGLREEDRLPNRMYYHLDHLTVVQNGFGDIIRMGDGDEVRDVPHPAAPSSGDIYQFRVADSLTITLPNTSEEIRVYEIQVRPMRTDRPALVGSVFVNRATADIVRMAFTFTPASYVDKRLDYISVSLDNGLWEGKYWLPNEQTVEIRRQLEMLDFAAGSVIQGRMRIRDYTFNDSIPLATFTGRTVGIVSREELDRFEFERGLYEDLDESGLAPPPSLAEIRREAGALLGTSKLSGLPGWRLNIESVSSLLRYNRAEGLAFGVGATYAPGLVWRADFLAGAALGPERPWGRATFHQETGADGLISLRVAFREPRDFGLRAAVPGLINSVTSLVSGDDYLDTYFVTGGRLSVRLPLQPTLDIETELIAERHRSASLSVASAPFNDDAQFRPVLRIDDGDLSAFTVALRRPAPAQTSGWGATARVEIGAFADGAYVRPTAEAQFDRESADHHRNFSVIASAGFVAGETPSQRLFLIGGQNTLPGYGYRTFAGDRFALVNVESRAGVFEPWVGIRAVGAIGAAGGLRSTASPAPAQPAWATWQTTSTAGIRTSAGAGLSLFWDVLRVDAVRGLNGGKWQVLIGFHREFWDIT